MKIGPNVTIKIRGKETDTRARVLEKRGSGLHINGRR